MHAVAATDEEVRSMTVGLAQHFGLPAFRPGQADVIASVLSGRNTVVVMPTGAGKSLCYQLPAMLLDGVTVVVSPLIALMHDQVESLTARGISATFINSTLSEGERRERQQRLRGGEYKLVYVAPERFKSDAFVDALRAANLALYAIDEAHCISQWGHDFRPDYARLGQVRKLLRPPRTVALTATATPEVRDDITRVLLMKEPQVYVAGFDRPNLFLEVATVTGDADKRDACVALSREGSGVVYCSTRKQAEGLHEHLVDEGVPAVLYHAGLDDDARTQAQQDFMQTKGCVAVATNAFGMGIDKPDIRWVAHAGIPRAVEAYYQEIGRAGRDGKPSRAVLLFNHADVFTQERLIQSNHPHEPLFLDLWNALRGHETWERSAQLLANQVGASEWEVSAALKVLERHGAISRGGRGEGLYSVTVLPAAVTHQPRSAEARAMLKTLTSVATNVKTGYELPRLAQRSGLSEDRVKYALSLLERASLITVQRPYSGRAMQILRHESWRDLGLDLSALRAQERNQLLLLKRMTDYAYSRGCRRAYLLRYFGERAAQQCGSCDVCKGAQLHVTPRASKTANGPTGAHALPVKYSAYAAEALKKWRRELSRDLNMPPFIIFNDATLYALAAALPTTRQAFLSVKGTGETKWERFGANVVRVCTDARAMGEQPQAVTTAVARRRRS